MDANDLQEFCRAHAPRLVGARIQRLRCTRYGLLLECRSGADALEWSFLGCRNAVWCLVGDNDQRATLLDALSQAGSPLASPCDDLDWREPGVTGLDALRVWLLQPAARPPEWFRLEGGDIRGVAAPAGERLLHIDIDTTTTSGQVQTMRLQAELFSRGLNLVLRDDAGEELANWQGRAAALPRTAAAPAAQPDGRDRPDLALRAWTTLSEACARELHQEARRDTRRQHRRLQQLVRGLEHDLERAAEAAAWRHKGELLTAHLHRVRKGQVHVSLPDWEAGQGTVDVELDPALTPQENAARFFKRAKRGERGHDTIAARLQAARDELGAVPTTSEGDLGWREVLRQAPRTWRKALDSDPGAARLRTLWTPGGPRWHAETPAVSRPRRPQERKATHPGRRFVLAGGWEVFVGRSNADNDELTHRFAHPQDVWLHAGGVAGSHVVLRMRGSTDNPPRDILAQAAAIAARFSKAKHAGTVPVIWTRKRHVRKPRGSKPGVAVCQHEKTIFVKPGVPGDIPEEEP